SIKQVACAREKALGRLEKTSNPPTNFDPALIGTANNARIPNWLHAAALALGSRSASSQSTTALLRIHSPERPDCASSRVPGSGAVAPREARHTNPPCTARAIAAPLACVARCARYATC